MWELLCMNNPMLSWNPSF